MRTTVWRPSTSLRKRRSKHASILDATGVVCTFVFLFVFLCVQISRAMLPHHRSWSLDLAVAVHSEPQPYAFRDNALNVSVTRDGSLYFGSNKVAMEELPQFLRTACLKGSERKVYLRADARANYRDVKSALNQISAAGIQDVAIIVEGPPRPAL